MLRGHYMSGGVYTQSPPHQGAIIGWHGEIVFERQTGAGGKCAERFEIAHAADRIARFEPLVELRVALRGKGAAVVKRSINSEYAAHG